MTKIIIFANYDKYFGSEGVVEFRMRTLSGCLRHVLVICDLCANSTCKNDIAVLKFKIHQLIDALIAAETNGCAVCR
jgi:hypothetical protein